MCKISYMMVCLGLMDVTVSLGWEMLLEEISKTVCQKDTRKSFLCQLLMLTTHTELKTN